MRRHQRSSQEASQSSNTKRAITNNGLQLSDLKETEIDNQTDKFHKQAQQAEYRVAQNKIPHQTICNIFATSGQILKILEAV